MFLLLFVCLHMASSLPHFPAFDATSDIQPLSHRWTRWMQKFENFLLAMNVTQAARKRALLLHYAGDSVYDIFCTLDNVGTTDDYSTAVTRLNEYFMPRKNLEYENYIFRQARQERNETIDQFQTRLRKLSAGCEFANVDREIKSQLIQGCSSSVLRRHALRDSSLTLSGLLTLAGTMEASERQAAQMEQKEAAATVSREEETVHRIHASFSSKDHKNTDSRKFSRQPNTRSNCNSKRFLNKNCLHCNGVWPHKGGQDSCPAKGKSCHYCRKYDHFESCCRKKLNDQSKPSNDRKHQGTRSQTANINAISSDLENLHCDSEDPHKTDDKVSEAYLFSVISGDSPVKTAIEIFGNIYKFYIDTGATVNVMDSVTFNSLPNKPKLECSERRVFVYGSNTPLKLLGKISVPILAKKTGHKALTTFYIAPGKGGCLLGYESSIEFKLIEMANILSTVELNADHCVSKYPQLFDATRIGELKDVSVHLHIDKSVPPVAQHQRRVPFHIRNKLEKELNSLQKLDIIEKATGPTPWVSPIVIVPKPNKPDEIRLCVDMREANRAIIRERHTMPTIDDIITVLNGSRVYTKLDLNRGYHQLKLDMDSRHITTFSTHLGLYRYKRLSFGISAASEIFQNEIRKVIQGIPGVFNMSDDILVHGKGQKEHDLSLDLTLARL